MKKIAPRGIVVGLGIIVLGIGAAGVYYRDALVENYYLHRLESEDAEARREAGSKLVEMASTKAIVPLIRLQVSEKRPTFEGLIDIAARKPEEFSRFVESAVSNERFAADVRCFAIYLLSEIAWQRTETLEAVELATRSQNSAVEQFARSARDQINDNLTRKGGPRLGLMVMQRSDGLLVGSVLEYSSSWCVGIRDGDVITRIKETEVHSLGDMVRQTREVTSGELVPITLIRDDQQVETHLCASSEPSGVAPLLLEMWTTTSQE